MTRKIIFTFALACLCVILPAVFRPSPMLPDRYYEMKKYDWHHNCDVVIGGDSRAEMGVVPSEMAGILHCRVRNYGFLDLRYTEDYYKKIADCIDPKSNVKIIVLGVQPAGFTGVGNCSFNYAVAMQPSRRRIKLLLIKYKARFKVFDIANNDNNVRVLHPDGFYEMKTDYWTTRKEDFLAKYKKSQPADPQRLRELCDFAATCKAKGITVVAVRIPTSPELEDVQDTKWDEKAVQADFVRAGGVWLNMSRGTYDTFDGSHLRVSEAKRFSRNLAIKIKEREDDK